VRALQVHALTGPDAVAVADVPEPEAGDGQILVDVRAGGVSFVDLLLTRGEYQLKLEPPFTWGFSSPGPTRRGAASRG
jgi:NADPH2:quinone reductase